MIVVNLACPITHIRYRQLNNAAQVIPFTEVVNSTVLVKLIIYKLSGAYQTRIAHTHTQVFHALSD